MEPTQLVQLPALKGCAQCFSGCESTIAPPCVLCLDLLSAECCRTVVEMVIAALGDRYQFGSFCLQLNLPQVLFYREALLLSDLSMADFNSRVKMNWRKLLANSIVDKLGVQYCNKDYELLVCITPSNEVLANEHEALLTRIRKQHRTQAKTVREGVLTSKALQYMLDYKNEFVDCLNFESFAPWTFNICVQATSVFVAGRYCKLVRNIPQTPWFCDGEWKADTSVQQLIEAAFVKHFQCDETKFASSGREDCDALMLGRGRPFVLELVNPKRRSGDIRQLSAEINEQACGRITVRDMQLVAANSHLQMKQGEEKKTKVYRALCVSAEPLCAAQVDRVVAACPVVVHQKTPIRVLHRRSLLTRTRTVHSARATLLGPLQFTLQLECDAGFYVKEFVHSDLGRTDPNVTKIVGVDCDITELDVLEVKLDWPPTIE